MLALALIAAPLAAGCEDDSTYACTNTCSFAGDSACDDGGPGSSYSVCEFGTDCQDCGVRITTVRSVYGGPAEE